MNQQMVLDRAEIERLEAETNVIKARTQARLDALMKRFDLHVEIGS